MEKKQRIEYIDLMKGICIVLVVMHNSGLLSEVERENALLHALLCSRMPLYFFLSGLFFKTYGSFGAFLTKKVCMLVVPIVVFGIAGGLLMDCVPWTQWSAERISNPARWVVYVSSFLNIPLWFLRALFVGSLMMYGLHRLFGGSAVGRVVGGLIAAAAGVAVYVFSTEIPGLTELQSKLVYRSGVFNAGAMLLFLWLGALVGRSGVLAVRRTSRTAAAAALTGAVALVICMVVPVGSVSWCLLYFHAPWVNLMAIVISTILLVWAVSFLFQRVPYLSYLGRYSIVVLVTHYPMICTLRRAVGFETPVAVAITLAVMPAVVYCCVRWIPWACAQRQLAEWRDGRLRPASWLTAQINRVKSGIAEYFL